MSSGFNQKPTTSPYGPNTGNYLVANAMGQQQSRRASSGQPQDESLAYAQTSQKETSFETKGYQGSSTISDNSPYLRGQVPTIHQLMEENIRNNQQSGTQKNQQYNQNTNFSLGEAESPNLRVGYGEESYNPQPRMSQRAPNLQVSTGKQDAQKNSNYGNGQYLSNQPGYGSYESPDTSANQQLDSTFTAAYDRAVINNNQQGNSSYGGIEMTRVGQQEMQSSNKLLYNQGADLYNNQSIYDQSAGMPQTMSNTPLDQKGLDLSGQNMQRGHLAFKNANEKGAFLNKRPSGIIRSIIYIL